MADWRIQAGKLNELADDVRERTQQELRRSRLARPTRPAREIWCEPDKGDFEEIQWEPPVFVKHHSGRSRVHHFGRMVGRNSSRPVAFWHDIEAVGPDCEPCAIDQEKKHAKIQAALAGQKRQAEVPAKEGRALSPAEAAAELERVERERIAKIERELYEEFGVIEVDGVKIDLTRPAPVPTPARSAYPPFWISLLIPMVTGVPFWTASALLPGTQWWAVVLHPLVSFICLINVNRWWRRRFAGKPVNRA